MTKPKIGIAYTIIAAALGLALSSSYITSALAASPHFIFVTSSLSGSSLVCSFKEAGLANLGFQNVQMTCTATATATYVCVNNGGNHPQAANKETITVPVSGGGTFPISNGQTTGTITIAAPGPGSFSCPGGQTLRLSSVTYTGIQVCDLTVNDCQAATPSTQRFVDSSVPT
jgi:hypothetical protein